MLSNSIVFSLIFLISLTIFGLFDGETSWLRAQELAAAEGESSRGASVLDEIVVSATRTEQSLSKVTSSVSVLTRADIEKQPAVTLMDTLKDTPGVTVDALRGQYGSSTNNRVIIRGLGSSDMFGRVLILVDGLVAVSPDVGIFDWTSINTDSVERIEVIRGPSSALYGSNAMGGVINIITRRPKEDGFKTTLTSKFGPDKYKSGNIYHEGKVGGFFYNLAVGHKYANGFSVLPRHSNTKTTGYNVRAITSFPEKLENTVVNLKAGYIINETADFTVGYTFNDFENTGRYDIPGYRVFDLRSDTFTFQFHKNFGLVDSRLNFRAENSDTIYDQAALNGRQLSYSASNKIKYYYVDLINTFNFGDYNRVTVGLAGSYGKSDRGYPYYTSNRKRSKGGTQKNIAIFAQDEISLFDDTLQIVPGFRYDHWETEGYDQDSSIPTKPGLIKYPKDVNKSFNSKIGFNYNPWKDKVIFRANFGQAFRVATLNDRYGGSVVSNVLYNPNPNLKPEKSHTIDLGVEVNPIDQLNVSLTGYETKAKDFIGNKQIATYAPYSRVYDKVNIARVTIKGLEGSLKYYPAQYWTVFAEGDFNHSRITGGPEKGDHLIDVPENKFSLGVLFDHPKWFTLRVGALRIGRIWTSQDREQCEGNFWTGDLRLSRRFEFDKIWFEPYVEVNNITRRDELRYTNGARTPINTVYAGLSVGF
ncbi:MAG: TonB-dependent receptor [Deltaproteobacteria bacterium]|jgi:outer membrane cobalamin receptor|nr:TonB-dependent receptor [Deltaproteobacteria bacterium]